MKKNLGVVPGIYPMPVLMVAAYDENGKVNVMNAAWGMICGMDKIALFIDDDRKTRANILKTKAFTVSLADKDHIDVADFFGIATGNKMDDKFERTGYTAVKSEFVNAPIIEEFPLVLECEFLEITKTDHMDAVVGKIINTAADEKVLDSNGKVNPAKLNALIFDQFQSGYYICGEKVGQAWNAGKELMNK
ncbi:MAG: flavin reductase family protein [Clostridia bacterium]|nr:flavin reductase family protein [Clostridia bacterium]